LPFTDTSSDPEAVLPDGDDEIFSHLDRARSTAAVRGALWSAVNSIIPTVLNGAVFIVTSQFLAPNDFGLVALAVAIVSFANAFAPASYADALVQNHSIRRSHVDSVFWLILSTSTVLYAVVALSGAIIAYQTGHPLLIYLMPILGLRLIFDNLATVPAALISRSMAFHLFTVRTAISTAVSAAFSIGLILAGLGLWAIVAAQLSASVASCVASYWSIGWRPGLRIKRAALRDLSHYGLYSSGNRFLQMMSLDQILLGSLAGTQMLGIFNFSRRLYQMILDVVGGTLTSVSHTMFASMQHEIAKTREAFLLSTFISSMVAFPAFMGLAAVADDAIPLIFGAQWADAIWPVRGFCVIGLMSSIGVIQATLITSLGKAHWWFFYMLFRNILSVATVWLLWSWGINAIVLAMVIQIIAVWPLTIWMVSRIIDLNPWQYLRQFLRPAMAFLMLLAATTGVGMAMSGAAPVLRLLAGIAAGGIAYLAVIGLTCRPELTTLVRAVLKKRQDRSAA